ncbi:hypothetical protein MET9862_00338 [Methylobacterium symbioticum]|uniref:Uncharacterized protein n=1 Tax=Methylobacterium symbioticum TaxID=2584084 RepID=A0A509E6K0_9HYPH|nr:hypothetical protein MET9862_00338 [Methylobacterium symbioticum]
MGDGLVEEGERVAHRTLGGAHQGAERLVLDRDALRSADALEMGGEHVGLDAAQVEALAAREDRDRDLADLGGGEHELGVRRRLLQGLQEGVERLLREHVDLVHDVDLVAGRDGGVADAVDDAAHVVDAGMRGGVHLQHVHVPGFHDRLAVQAEFRHRHGGAGIGRAGTEIVQPAGEDARRGGLADAAHARQHPGLRDAAGCESVAQRAHHGALADQVVEILGPVLAREHPVGRGRGGLGAESGKPRRVVRGAGARVHATNRGRRATASDRARPGGPRCAAHRRKGGRLDEDPLGLVRAASFRT